MAYTHSGWYIHTLLDGLLGVTETGTPTAIKITQDANLYISLHSSSGTDYASELAYGAASPAWVATNEIVSSGGNWTSSGGVVLSTANAGGDVTTTATITGSGPYVLTYSWTALSVTNTTFTGVYGMIIYFHDITASVSKPMLLNICFGSSYNTVSGTFGITPSGSGLSAITLTA